MRKSNQLMFLGLLLACFTLLNCKKNDNQSIKPPLAIVPALDTINAIPLYGTPFNNMHDATDAII